MVHPIELLFFFTPLPEPLLHHPLMSFSPRGAVALSLCQEASASAHGPLLHHSLTEPSRLLMEPLLHCSLMKLLLLPTEPLAPPFSHEASALAHRAVASYLSYEAVTSHGAVTLCYSVSIS
ncbi:hypothetical protein L208DRAFT_612652 [Tricholoma matsutake]|nr:hypothetical protein L208DRAFT_612652 [Tricholoma matsutake 945]